MKRGKIKADSNKRNEEEQMVKEESAENNLKKSIEKEREKSTYAAVLLKGTGERKKKVSFKL